MRTPAPAEPPSTDLEEPESDHLGQALEAIVDLHRTRPDLAACPPGVAIDAGDVLRRAGAADGQPFILGPDGSYDLEPNRFLRELDAWGVRAPNSIDAYARDLMLFCRFLHEARWQVDLAVRQRRPASLQARSVADRGAAAGVGGDLEAVDCGAGQVGALVGV